MFRFSPNVKIVHYINCEVTQKYEGLVNPNGECWWLLVLVC